MKQTQTFLALQLWNSAHGQDALDRARFASETTTQGEETQPVKRGANVLVCVFVVESGMVEELVVGIGLKWHNEDGNAIEGNL